MSRLALIATLFAFGCATAGQLPKFEEAYRSDTLLVNKLVGPMGIEPAHGQVTVAISSKFTEKLLRASLQPNVLTLSVATPGRVYKQEVTKLAIAFDNGVWLNEGRMALAFAAENLELRGDLISLRGNLDGHGVVSANLKFYGVPLKRDVELWTQYADTLQFHFEKGEAGWLLRLVGGPLKVHVDVKVPALKVAGVELLPLKFSRDLEFPVDRIAPFALPLPTPRTVKAGSVELTLGLSNLSVGTHDGTLWLAADLMVGLPATTPPPPPPSTPVPPAPTIEASLPAQ
jgi:hypothetical protein